MNKSPFKWVALSVGGVIAVAHIGVLGHLMDMNKKYADRPQYPSINLPTGEYSSYDVNVNREGYSIRYNANDPRVLTSERSLDLDKEKKGLFGGGTEQRREWRRDEYTMDGTRNVGGGADEEGKLSAKDVECIKAEGGAQAQGAMVGTSIAASAAPMLTGIPYIGWLAVGWANLLGQRAGSAVGSEVGSVFNDC
tara:strand:- start:981 stop:1562 length:582 start_codon:yes stop_codon:yes gene_type:complete